MVFERTVTAVTNEDIYNLCLDIQTSLRDYAERIIANQQEIASKLNSILNKLDEIYEGIKTLSDNDVVLDEKIEVIRRVVNELRAVLPGV